MIICHKLLYLILLFSLLKADLGENEQKESSSSAKKSGLNLSEIFIVILSVVVGIVLFCYITSKILDHCCETGSVIQILKEEYEKNNLINNNDILLEAKKMNLNKIFSFLLEKVFVSSKYDESKNIYENNCTICLNVFKPDDKTYITQCDHMFHQNCMKKYLNLIKIDIQNKSNVIEMNNYFKCPNCKQYLFYNKKVDLQHKMQEKNLIDQNNAVIMVNKKDDTDSENYERKRASFGDNISNMNDTPISTARKDLKNSFTSEESSIALSKRSQNSNNSWARRYKNKKFISKNKFINNNTNNNENSSKNFAPNSESDSNCQQKSLKLKEYPLQKQSLNIYRNVPTVKETKNIEIFDKRIGVCNFKNEKEDDK